MDAYSVRKEDFQNLRPKINFSFVHDVTDIYNHFAHNLADLIKANNQNNKETVAIIPVGPIQYTDFVNLCNEEGISCKNLITINMDEYLTNDGKYIAYDHPLSFRRYMNENLFEKLDKDKRTPEEQRIFPDPENTGKISQIIKEYGMDICYAGVGISGHLAFNDPPESKDEMTEENVKNSITRVVNISRETRTGIAIGGTNGNWDIIPRKAITVGMKEILSAKKIQMYGMRSWHSGTLRRALFGSISPEWPSSYVQLHPNVSITWTSYAAEIPLPNVTMAIGR